MKNGEIGRERRDREREERKNLIGRQRRVGNERIDKWSEWRCRESYRQIETERQSERERESETERESE